MKRSMKWAITSMLFAVVPILATVCAFLVAVLSTKTCCLELMGGIYVITPVVSIVCGFIALKLKDDPLSKLAHNMACFAIMIAALVVVLSLFALPSFAKSRSSARRCGCINNLRQIDGAKDTWALEYGGTNGMILTWEQAGIYLRDYKNKLYCPESPGGNTNYASSYRLNAVGENPECLMNKEHTLRYKVK